MRGTKAAAVDEDYEAGADAEEGRPTGSEKPLSSRYRGVCWNRKNRRWQAAINSGGKYVYLGSFLSEYDAARAFDKAAVKLRGTRAKLNFPYSEYVDENGNLLEDPKMKNVMYKIEAIQGGGGQANGGGSAGHHISGSGGGGRRSDPGGTDEGHLLHGDGTPLALPLPLPPSQVHEDVIGTQPAAEPIRQLSPLIPGGGGGGAGSSGGSSMLKQPHHTGSSEGGKLPDWQGSRGGALQVVPLLNLAAPPTVPQPQQRSQPHGSAGEPPLYCAVTTGGSALPQGASSGGGGGGGGGGVTRGPDVALPGPPLSVQSPASGASGRMPYPSARGRAGGPQPPSPMHPEYGSGYDAPPGVAMVPPPGHTAAGAVAAPLPPPPPGPPAARAPSSNVQHALMHDLSSNGGSITIWRYVDNRFQGAPEYMCGALYSDSRAPGRVGAAVWNGKCVIRMGMYDTERDACQAAIRCMQLNCFFRLDQSRADFFNALMDAMPEAVDSAVGVVRGGGAGQDPYDVGPQPYGGARGGAARSSGSGGGGNGLVLCDASYNNPQAHLQSYHQTAHQHHQTVAYGTRGSGGGGPGLSYTGPECSNAVNLLLHHQQLHQQQHNQQQHNQQQHHQQQHQQQHHQQQHHHQQQQQHHQQHQQDQQQHQQQHQQHQQQQQGPPSPGPSSGGPGYGSMYHPRADESRGAALQLADGHKHINMNSLFEAMKQYQNGIKTMNVGSTRGVGGIEPDSVSESVQDGDGPGGGGVGTLGKRALHSDYAAHHELASLHRPPRHGAEPKRMRLDPGPGVPAPLELRLEPPSREFHDAHKIPLPMVIKTWQQQQQQAAAGAL